VDAADNLYVADHVGTNRDRIQRRDAEGNWSVIATYGTDLGQIGRPTALTVDAAGNLYIAEDLTRNEDEPPSSRIQKRDVQGDWSVLAVSGDDQIQYGGVPHALAVDAGGNLFLAYSGWYVGWIQMRDAQGNWSLIAGAGSALGQISPPCRLAVDGAGNLYVAGNGRIEKRDPRGTWTLIAARGPNPGQVDESTALAVDSAGNLFVADTFYPGDEPLGGGAPYGRIQKRDAQGNWSLIAALGSAPGQLDVDRLSGLAVDAVDRLYVSDTGNNRVLMYSPGP
jgi:hypothetical protein